MQQKFEEIKKAFAKIDRELQKKSLTVYDTEKGIWGASSVDVVFEFFKKIKLEKFNSFLDIGCGDGRVVAVASLFTKAFGIEFEKKLVTTGNSVIKSLGLKNAKLIKDDFFEHDFSKYDILFSNPDTGFYNGLEDKLMEELHGTLLVYNPIFQPRLLKRGKRHWINGTPITEYKKN